MKSSRVLLGCLIIIVLATTASAEWAPVTDDIPLNSLPGGVLVVGDKEFSQFVLNGSGSGGASPDFNEMSVQGVQSDSGDYGLRFNEFNWSVGSNQSITVDLSFKVSILPDLEYENYFIKDVWMYFTGAGATGTGVVSASENVWDEFPSEPPEEHIIASLSCSKQYGDGGAYLVDFAEFDPIKEIYIQTKSISINGGTNGTAHFSEFFQFYSQVPEPATVSLLALGSLVLLRKRRFRY